MPAPYSYETTEEFLNSSELGRQIIRIRDNVSAALTAIGNKGVTVPSGSNSDDLADLIGAIQTGGGTPSATQHTIRFDLWDESSITVPIYYDDGIIGTIITASKPSMYNNLQIVKAYLDGNIWWDPKHIPLNTQLIDFTKLKEHYGLDDDNGVEEEYEWTGVTDYILVDPAMTFSIINYRWFGLYFYDTNKNFIDAMQTQSIGNATIDENDNAHGTLTGLYIPSNAEYLRLVIGLNTDETTASVIRIQ